MPTKQTTKSKSATANDDKVFTEAERAAVAATARERKAATGRIVVVHVLRLDARHTGGSGGGGRCEP